MNRIPAGAVGLGLRIPHLNAIFDTRPEVDFFEIISENFMDAGGKPGENLARIIDMYPVVLHGVSMSLGSADPLNNEYLKSLKSLVERCGAPYFTDHLCWGELDGIHLHDLLPLPFTLEFADYIAEKVKIVQDFVNVPFGIENLSSYATFKSSEMTEWDFLNHVVEKSGCSYMVDINNIYVSSVNNSFDPQDYVKALDWSKVLQCHIAGHSKLPDGTLLDTHDHPVSDKVWELYRFAWNLSGGFPTLLEWDSNFLSFEETWKEALKSREFQNVGVK